MAADAIKPGVVFAVDTGEASEPPLYVAVCDCPKDWIFSQAGSLYTDSLSQWSYTGQDVGLRATSLVEPEFEERIAELLVERKIFDEHGFFRVGRIMRGELMGLTAVGVGTSNAKLQRAAKLALAVALAMESPDSEAWLRENSVRIEQDPLCSRGRSQSLRLRSRSRSRCKSTDPRIRSRSPHFQKSGRGGARAGPNRMPQAEVVPVLDLRQDSESFSSGLPGDGQASNFSVAKPRPPSLASLAYNQHRFARGHGIFNFRDGGIGHASSSRDDPQNLTTKREMGFQDEDLVSHEDEQKISTEWRRCNSPKTGPYVTIHENEEGALIAEDKQRNLNMEPPQPWVLIYDFAAKHHYYWHPNMMQSSWDPPPGSRDVSEKAGAGNSGASKAEKAAAKGSAVYPGRAKKIATSFGEACHQRA